jgi:cation diffusion facilitator CzcD-associated flavoprotein CzcO
MTRTNLLEESPMTNATRDPVTTVSNASPDVDVVVVGAGFAGLYMLHRLRGLGLTAYAGFVLGARAAAAVGD